MPDLPVRKSIRLARFNYLGDQLYFVTLCCFRRQNLFADPNLCNCVLILLRTESAVRNFRVLAYCAMPDHLHFLTQGMDPRSDFLHFIKSFKIKTSREYAGQQSRRPLWQRGYYEHILRPSEVVEAVAWYIWMNPVRKGIVSRPQAYRFAGSFSGLAMPTAWDKPQWVPPWRR